MSFHKIHFLSLTRFLNTMASEISSVTGKTAPAVINLDAHAQISELPLTDFIGLIGFGLHKIGPMITVHTGIGVSTYDDPDMLRHADVVDYLSNAVDIGTRIPLFSNQGGAAVETNWMVASGNMIIEPVDQAVLRSFQVVTVQFQSGVSGQA